MSPWVRMPSESVWRREAARRDVETALAGLACLLDLLGDGRLAARERLLVCAMRQLSLQAQRALERLTVSGEQRV